MRIKVTEEQLQSIVANEQRNHVTMRTKKVKSAPTKEYGTSVSKVMREGPVHHCHPWPECDEIVGLDKTQKPGKLSRKHKVREEDLTEEELDERIKRRVKKRKHFVTDVSSCSTCDDGNAGMYKGPKMPTNEEHDCAKVHPEMEHDDWAKLNEEELTEGFYQYIKENNISEEDINEERLDEFFKMRASVAEGKKPFGTEILVY